MFALPNVKVYPLPPAEDKVERKLQPAQRGRDGALLGPGAALVGWFTTQHGLHLCNRAGGKTAAEAEVHVCVVVQLVCAPSGMPGHRDQECLHIGVPKK